MNITVVCTKFNIDSKNSYLTNDLCYAFAELGHKTTVICLDWEGKQGEGVYHPHKNITLYNYQDRMPHFLNGSLKPLKKILKWLLFSIITKYRLPKEVTQQSVDLLIDFSPAITTRSIFNFLNKKVRYTSLMILWDFFPEYHYQLGLVPKVLLPYLKYSEEEQINAHEFIGCMSKGNIDFLKQNYKLNSKIKPFVLPLWGPKEPPQIEENKNIEQFFLKANSSATYCVFGGQLIPGRGLNLIVELAKKCSDLNLNIVFFIAGDGPLKEWLLETLTNYKLNNIHFVGYLGRNDYYQLLLRSSVGLVFNSGHVTVPTYPSKTIDYFRCKLPIIGAVELASDYSDIIQNQIKAGFSSSNNIDDILKNLIKLHDNPSLRKELGLNGYNYFQQYMTSESIALHILRLI